MAAHVSRDFCEEPVKWLSIPWKSKSKTPQADVLMGKGQHLQFGRNLGTVELSDRASCRAQAEIDESTDLADQRRDICGP